MRIGHNECVNICEDRKIIKIIKQESEKWKKKQLIKNKMIKQKLIDEALQQFTGFKIGKWSNNIRELISSMGLKKEEWEYIKRTEDPDSILDEEDVEEINKIFKEDSA